ncbi:MAG: hypothetical protein WCT35_00205 [Sideroxydans sp.]|jgi:hypothetical protein
MDNSKVSISDAIIEYWKRSPTWAKIYWAFSTILTSGALTSLGETVFAWKGFILTGITFYRSMLAPVKTQLHFIFEVEISPSQIDLIVIFGLFFASYLRFTMAKQLSRIIESRKTKALYVRAIVALVLVWSLVVGFISGVILVEINILLRISVIPLYIFPFFYPFLIINYDKLNIPNQSSIGLVMYMEKLREYSIKRANLYLEYYGPAAISFALIFVLAAINSGLLRE